MTDDKIIKALTEWSERGMTFCNVGMSEFARSILGLISRQKEELDIELNIMNRQNNEIWQLKEEIKRLQNERKPNEGKWIEHYSFDVWHYDCPFCDDGYATKGRDTTPPNFCSNCGAKLSGVKCEENNND